MRSIQAKLVAAVAGCMLALVLVTTFLVSAASREQQQRGAREALRASARALATVEQAETEKLSATLDALLANPALQEAFVARDRDRLLAAARPVFEGLRERFAVTHLYFLEPPPARTTFLRVHKPELRDDPVSRATYAKAVETGGVGAGKELGKTAFALRVVKPWRVDGKVVGYVELGEEIDHFLAKVKAVTGDDLALAVEKKHLDEAEWALMARRSGRRNAWGDRPATVVVNATTDDAHLEDFEGQFAALPADGVVLDELERGDRVLERGVVPVQDAAGRVVGGLFVLHDDSFVHGLAERQRNLLVGAIAAVAIGLAALLAVLLRRLVLVRLSRMVAKLEEASERLAGGDCDVGATLVPSGDDEIGRFEAFFARFLGVVGELVRAASGDRKAG